MVNPALFKPLVECLFVTFVGVSAFADVGVMVVVMVVVVVVVVDMSTPRLDPLFRRRDR